MIRIIVIYDIAKDRTRNRVSNICQDYGLDREQYSVFAGLLKARQVRALAKELRHEVREEGHIVLVPIAADDWERRIEMGDAIHGD